MIFLQINYQKKYPTTYETWASLSKIVKSGKCTRSESWDNFKTFFFDMGEQPTGKVLCRIDLSKPYDKDNCFWGDKEDRDIVINLDNLIEYNGVFHTANWLSKKYNVAASTIKQRYKDGIRGDELFSKTPIRRKPFVYHPPKDKSKLTGRRRKGTEFTIIDNIAKGEIFGGKITIDVEDIPIVSQYTWRINKSNHIESRTTINGKYKRIFLHRLLMNVLNEDWTKVQVDHINHDPTDNRKSNLRLCSCAQNQINRGVRKDNTTGVTGVSFDKTLQRWIATISFEGKNIYLGSFKEKELAIQARIKKEKELYGEFSAYNN